MKRKMLLLNNYSIVSFFISSFSLLGVPFINMDDGLPKISYVLAMLFWIGLLVGIILQIVAYSSWKKIKQRNIKKKRGRKFLIPIIFFLILFFLILILWNKSVALISIDLALLLFSIETYFYFKRRYSV